MTDPKKPEVLKPFTLTTIGTVAAVLAFSTGCIHFNPGVVAEAKKSQEVAEHEMNADPSPHNPKPGNS